MPQPIRSRACEMCGEPFEFTRSTASYCSDTCSKRARRGAQPSWTWRERVVHRPRTLAHAVRALEAGVPLRDLILEADEQAVLVAVCRLFDGEQRLAATARLAQRLGRLESTNTSWGTKIDAGWVDERWDRAGARHVGAAEVRVPSDIELGIIDVLEKAFEPCDSFPSPHSDQRRKVEWIPADWDWKLLFNAYLEWALRKEHIRPREADPLSFADRFEAVELPREVVRVKSFAWADPLTGLANPFGGRGGSEGSARTFHPRRYQTMKKRRKEAIEVTVAEANAVAERLEAVQRKADELFERVSATLEEMKWRFPNDEDVTDAVEQLIERLSG